MAQRLKRLPANVGVLDSIPGSGRSPGEGNGNSLVFLPGESHGWRSLVGYSPRGHKESGMTERVNFCFNFPVVLPGKYLEWRNLEESSPWVRKELDTTE